ncbi:unnamed protein product [Rotaria sordida]|uniref:Uncharacterized protein n=1 Tax=Rotaria sordida TaxID=392033 RepID=A0A819IA75_9BILA|nr:unnamed protein product [Rotaria sordida]
MVSFSEQGFRQKYEAIIEDMETNACIGGQTSDSLAFQEYSAVMQDETKQYCRRSIIREFCLNTSTHALPGIARSETIVAYLKYPTQIDVSYVSEWRQYFSAFSLCNASPFRFDKFKEPFFNYIKTRNLTDSNDTTTLSPFQAHYIRDFLIDKINRNESLKPLFYPLSSMLSTCSFNVVPWLETDFLPFISSTYGLCYTFNAKLKYSNNDSIRYGNKNGADGNLKLGLYVHNHQYVPYCGCVNPNLWSTRSVILSGTDKIILVSLCNASNTYYTEAVDTLLASSILMNTYCSDCSQQCLITNFIIQTSSLATPVE